MTLVIIFSGSGLFRFVAVYFSASWCRPCRQFTPHLAELYENLKEQDPTALEIVFVSSDSEESDFQAYYDEMPWTAVSFGSDLIDSLTEKFEVNGIPAMIVLDGKDGSVKDNNGRSTIMNAHGDTEKLLREWV